MYFFFQVKLLWQPKFSGFVHDFVLDVCCLISCNFSYTSAMIMGHDWLFWLHANKDCPKAWKEPMSGKNSESHAPELAFGKKETEIWLTTSCFCLACLFGNRPLPTFNISRGLRCAITIKRLTEKGEVVGSVDPLPWMYGLPARLPLTMAWQWLLQTFLV